MKTLKIAANTTTHTCFNTTREIVDIHQTDFTDIAAAVLSVEDVRQGIDRKSVV